MMHTVEEAKELWCPMARVAQIGAVETPAVYNRVLLKVHVPVKFPENDELNNMETALLKTETQLSGSSRCVADKCAMWRWSRKRPVYRDSVPCRDPKANAEPQRPAGLPPDFVFVPHEPLGEPACWQEPDEAYAARLRLHGEGYCGLAGNPVAN